MLFVTHDMDEALQIADRILVFGPRPSSVVKEIRLPREKGLRNLSADALVQVKAEMIALIR